MSPTNAQSVTCISGYCNCPTNAPVAGTSCVLNCMEEDICKGSILSCRSGDSCTINCNAKGACSGIMIHAQNATDITVICSSEASCSNRMDIICGSGDCLLQCDGTDSCVNLSYSTVKQTVVYKKQLSILSSISTANPTAMIFIVLIMVCCTLTVLCSAFNCLFRRNMKQKQKEKEEVLSKSRVSTTIVSQRRKSSVSTPHQYHARTPRTSSVYTMNSINTNVEAVTPLPYLPYNTPRADIADNADDIGVGHESPYSDATFPTLPLSMTIPEFKVHVSSGVNGQIDEQEDDPRDSVSSSNSNRV